MGEVIQLPQSCRFHCIKVHLPKLGEKTCALAARHHLQGICKAQIARSVSQTEGLDTQAQMLDRSLAFLPAWDWESMHAGSILTTQGRSKALASPL